MVTTGNEHSISKGLVVGTEHDPSRDPHRVPLTWCCHPGYGKWALLTTKTLRTHGFLRSPVKMLWADSFSRISSSPVLFDPSSFPGVTAAFICSPRIGVQASRDGDPSVPTSSFGGLWKAGV